MIETKGLGAGSYPEPPNVNDKEYKVTVEVSAKFDGYIHAKNKTEAFKIAEEMGVDELELDKDSITIHELKVKEV